MFPNLRAEMARFNVANKDLITLLGKSKKGIGNRLSGRQPFTHPEMLIIRDKYFPGMTIDYLFSNERQVS